MSEREPNNNNTGGDTTVTTGENIGRPARENPLRVSFDPQTRDELAALQLLEEQSAEGDPANADDYLAMFGIPPELKTEADLAVLSGMSEAALKRVMDLELKIQDK